MKANKTNAARLLDKAGVPYRLIAYDADEHDLSAVHLAEQIGQDVSRVFKTLVLRGDRNGLFVCVIPGGHELDLKKAAKVSGNKSCAMVAVKDLFSLTGYIRGGCSPIGMKKCFPAYIHETVLQYDSVFVSAGQRGLQFQIAGDDLVKEAGADVCDLIV